MKIYRVGGSVRDELLGLPVADRDYVVVGATPDAMRVLGFRGVGRDFPVFLHPRTHEEHALARTERKSGSGHRGFVFHASPEVTLEQDLGRRDLTINAMARAEDGTLIDPFGGEKDLRAGVLRHIGPAFAEDPLRVLRVARFAARFGFAVAPETGALMHSIAASGELATLSRERIWQELSRALLERAPSRFVATLRHCGALGALLPEVDALFRPSSVHARAAGRSLLRALDFAATAGDTLAVRYAVLAGCLARGARARESRAERVSRRVNAPAECRELARLVARLADRVGRVATLSNRALLDLLLATDALRRPERLQGVVRACAAWHAAARQRVGEYRPGRELAEALAVVRSVDAGAASRGSDGSSAARRVRAARLGALRQWRRKKR
jgi:tRNA nucleotidyltransferase (CCA-adding enzyme)